MLGDFVAFETGWEIEETRGVIHRECHLF